MSLIKSIESLTWIYIFMICVHNLYVRGTLSDCGQPKSDLYIPPHHRMLARCSQDQPHAHTSALHLYVGPTLVGPAPRSCDQPCTCMPAWSSYDQPHTCTSAPHLCDQPRACLPTHMFLKSLNCLWPRWPLYSYSLFFYIVTMVTVHFPHYDILMYIKAHQQQGSLFFPLWIPC